MVIGHASPLAGQQSSVIAFVEENNDSVLIENKDREKLFITLSAKQIKSAIGNSGQFRKSNNNLLYSKADSVFSKESNSEDAEIEQRMA